MSQTSPLILASTSAYRRELLSRFGWAFRSEAPLFDEEAAKLKAPADPAEHAGFLARGKALSLSRPGSIVIGGDQLVSFQGQILGKPKTFHKAVDQLLQMNGQSHELQTAVCVVDATGNRHEWVDTVRMQMRRFSREQLEEYVRRDQPLDCAGSYKFEKQGLLLFEEVQCQDLTAIQGLPLQRLAKVLISCGLTPFAPVEI